MQYPVYTTYLLTNLGKTVLYTGVTGNLRRRLTEHWMGKEGSFTDRYLAHHLVGFEDSKHILNAIALEKEIKGHTRAKKDAIVTASNPD